MVVIKTAADGILDALKEDKNLRLPLSKLAGMFKTDIRTVERWADFMKGYVSVEYPTNVLSRPYAKLVREPKPPVEIRRVEGESLSTYKVSADKVTAEVDIVKSRGELVPVYQIRMPEVGPGTAAVLEGLSDELIKKVPITVEDLSDQRRMAKLKGVFRREASALVEKEFKTDISKRKGLGDILAGILLHNCYGMGSLEVLMNDDLLEEVCVNSSNMPLGAYHIKHGWVRTNIFIPSEKEIYNVASQIARKAGTTITNLEPIMDAHLVSGDRANSTLFPVSSFGNTITVRKFARVPWTLISLLKPEVNTISLDMASLLWLCMQYELNVLVTGGTASGKTSMLNAISALIPSNQRIVSIEATREINLPGYLHWNWIPLTTRNPNPEGKGEVTMLDLITNSLRMRPDRIIMGEVRRQEEAEVLFEAMHTGHSVYSTVHADTAQHLVRRMTKPPFALPLEDMESLDLVVVQFRDRRRGFRRVLEMAEVLQATVEEKLDLNYLYRWDARSDTFGPVNESRRLLEKLNLYTGMTDEEIRGDIAEKKVVLKWMLKNDVSDIESVGRMVGDYYLDKDRFLRDMRAGKLRLKKEVAAPAPARKAPVKRAAKKKVKKTKKRARKR